jgi:putative glutathione S-transferase
MLINGKWSKDFEPVHNSDGDGRFLRDDSIFRNWITQDGTAGPTGEGGFKAEPDRYHLYVALICPWASRTLMARKLKGLEKIISITVVEPFLHDQCWKFGKYPGAEQDPLYGFEYVHQLYTKAKSDYTGQVTVPILWDKKRQTIVNNESSDIIRMFNSGFGQLAESHFDLYPTVLRSSIDEINNRLYHGFNNAVYQAGFATTQHAYEEAVDRVFNSLDFIERHLEKRVFLVGKHLTEADIRAFVTMIRFDIAYYGLFKTNRYRLSDYPNISDYMWRIYEIPGIAETVDFDHIKQGYYSIKALNPLGIVPKGPKIGFYHNASKLSPNSFITKNFCRPENEYHS